MCLWSIGPHQHRHHLPGPEHGRRSSAQGQGRRPRQPACSEGISAVKALALAQAQGQRIYTITPSNAATALPKLPVGGEVGAEIRNAIQAGKEVTIHENPITAHGWTGYGYIIVDPETGAGAYLIEGKGNGGWLALAISILLTIIAIFPSVAALFSPPGILLLMTVVVVLTFVNFLDKLDGCGGNIGLGMALVAAVIAAIPGKNATALRLLLEGTILADGFSAAENAVCG